MAYEMLVGLSVRDDAGYAAYRRATAELLERYGGAFGYDFAVSRVLHSEGPSSLNRVFTLRFPSEADKTAFFADEEYLALRRRHFEPAVSEAVIIARYLR